MTEDERILTALHGLTVIDETGTEVKVTGLWRDRRTALIFIRHFG
jgi:hypothetical protein